MSAAPAFPRGVVPSMNTPFHDDGSVDLASIRRCAEATIQAGAAGMLILAVAGEGSSLSAIEKRQVTQAFIKQAAGRVPVIVGCSSSAAPERLTLASMARELGAPAMLCQVPDGMSGDALASHLGELAQVGPPLLMLQDLDWAGAGLALEDITLLQRRFKAFQAIKIEVVLPGPKYSAVLAASNGALHVSGGWAAAQMMEALHRGVHAFMPTALDRVYGRIFSLFHDGQIDAARALHARLAPVLAFSNQHIGVSIRFFKHLRQREGLFDTALCRPGVPALDVHQMRELDATVAYALALQSDIV
ncbi:MAG: dihydrodipicolinate synthase family protein [Variovorax sp.]